MQEVLRRTEQSALFAQSIAQGLKHSVLVTHPMSELAMSRLKTFFDVETRLEDRVPSGDELVDWLHGKAGVIADTRFIFDAQLVRRLPVLKAICNLDEAHHNLDLQALTSAGIRATSTPAPDAARLSAEARADKAWQVLGPLLQRAAPGAGVEGRYSGQWSRKVLLSEPLRMLSVGIIGGGAFADALAVRAQVAQVQRLRPGVDPETCWRTADVVVMCGADEGTPPPCVSAADMALLKPSAWLLNLAGPAALAAVSDAALLARVVNSDAGASHDSAASDQLWLNRTRVAAEELIASLGFGRNSWHPAHLLNTDILCDSCC